MKLPEPDGERIRAIITRARELHSRGQMERATWLQLNREFVEASHGQLEMPSALIDSGKSEWFEALKTAPSERAA
jgi:hypothetical protein